MPHINKDIGSRSSRATHRCRGLANGVPKLRPVQTGAPAAQRRKPATSRLCETLQGGPGPSRRRRRDAPRVRPAASPRAMATLSPRQKAASEKSRRWTPASPLRACTHRQCWQFLAQHFPPRGDSAIRACLTTEATLLQRRVAPRSPSSSISAAAAASGHDVRVARRDPELAPFGYPSQRPCIPVLKPHRTSRGARRARCGESSHGARPGHGALAARAHSPFCPRRPSAGASEARNDHGCARAPISGRVRAIGGREGGAHTPRARRRYLGALGRRRTHPCFFPVSANRALGSSRLLSRDAPQGTLIGAVMARYPDKFGFSVSHTTRQPRDGETDGVHYHFVDASVMRAEVWLPSRGAAWGLRRGVARRRLRPGAATPSDACASQVAEGKFVEHAEVHGNMYGTSKAAIRRVLDEGRCCVLDIDVQGARSMRASGQPALFVFVEPPSFAELERRLRCVRRALLACLSSAPIMGRHRGLHRCAGSHGLAGGVALRRRTRSPGALRPPRRSCPRLARRGCSTSCCGTTASRKPRPLCRRW